MTIRPPRMRRCATLQSRLLKRKRKFVEDAVAYGTVNGVLWLIWALTDRSADGLMPSARVGLGDLGLPPRGGRVASVRSLARKSAHRPITEADIQREIKQSHGK